MILVGGVIGGISYLKRFISLILVWVIISLCLLELSVIVGSILDVFSGAFMRPMPSCLFTVYICLHYRIWVEASIVRGVYYTNEMFHIELNISWIADIRFHISFINKTC